MGMAAAVTARSGMATAVVGLIGAVWILTAQQTPRPAAFTTQQATAGRVVYEASCAGCHMPGLQGRGEAPQVAGSEFMNLWGDRTAHDLIAFIQGSMPPLNAGSLSPDDYVNVTAFLLQANGATAGNQPLTAASAFVVRNVATGAVTISQGQRAPAAGTGRFGHAGLAPGRGLTVSGEVKNYTPVTDEMLRHPDPVRLADGAA